MAASKKTTGPDRKPGGKGGRPRKQAGNAGGGDDTTTGPTIAPVEPVKIGRPRTSPPEIADARAAKNARYRARKAGELPPVETTPVGSYIKETAAEPEGWRFSFADAAVEIHEACAQATGIEKFRVKPAKMRELEQCVLGVMSDKGIELGQEKRNVVGLVILLVTIYLPIAVALIMAYLDARKPKTAPSPIQRPVSPEAPAATQPQTVKVAPAGTGMESSPLTGGDGAGFFSSIDAFPETRPTELGNGLTATGAFVDGDLE